MQQGALREAWQEDQQGLAPLFRVREECRQLSSGVYCFAHAKPRGMMAHQDAESRGFSAVLCLRATTDGSDSCLDITFEEDPQVGLFFMSRRGAQPRGTDSAGSSTPSMRRPCGSALKRGPRRGASASPRPPRPRAGQLTKE